MFRRLEESRYMYYQNFNECAIFSIIRLESTHRLFVGGKLTHTSRLTNESDFMLYFSLECLEYLTFMCGNPTCLVSKCRKIFHSNNKMISG